MVKKANQRGVIYLPESVWIDLKTEAARRGMSMGEVVMEALRARPIVTKTREE